MSEVVTEWIMQAISLVLIAAVVSSLVVVNAAFQEVNAAITTQQAEADFLLEYRKYNQFDNKQVKPQDVISVIYKNRGNPTVYVKSSKGDFVWSTTNRPCSYNTQEIIKLIDQKVIYHASLRKGSNNEVVAYEFTAIS